MKMWHLRFAITSTCNLKCKYCNSHGKLENGLSDKEIREIIQAARSREFERLHWTGGEPLVKKNILDIMRFTKNIGYIEQAITTNGLMLAGQVNDLVDAGVTRFNVSIDTMDPNLFKEITTVDGLPKVLKGIEEILEKSDKNIKLNMVVMKDNLNEVGNFINYADEKNRNYGKERILVRFLQFFPCQPNQLKIEGQAYWKREYITEEDILNQVKKLGPISQIDNKDIIGDNPTMIYFSIKGKKAKIGLLAMFNWNYVCGDCHKLRVTPQGFTSCCLSDPDMFKIEGLSLKDKEKLIDFMINRRNTIVAARADRKHYRRNLGEVRFGKDLEGLDVEEFYKLLKK
jgi:GTP 3',8-cyclase